MKEINIVAKNKESFETLEGYLKDFKEGFDINLDNVVKTISKDGFFSYKVEIELTEFNAKKCIITSKFGVIEKITHDGSETWLYLKPTGFVAIKFTSGVITPLTYNFK